MARTPTLMHSLLMALLGLALGATGFMLFASNGNPLILVVAIVLGFVLVTSSIYHFMYGDMISQKGKRVNVLRFLLTGNCRIPKPKYLTRKFAALWIVDLILFDYGPPSLFIGIGEAFVVLAAGASFIPAILVYVTLAVGIIFTPLAFIMRKRWGIPWMTILTSIVDIGSIIGIANIPTQNEFRDALSKESK